MTLDDGVRKDTQPLSVNASEVKKKSGRDFLLRSRRNDGPAIASANSMIRKLKTGEYRLYSRKKDAKSGRRKNLGTFSTREAAEKHERAVQYFKRAG